MSDIAIRLSNLSKYYKLYDNPRDRVRESFSLRGRTYHKKHHALRDVSLEIKRGEILGVVGRNGCGKSTLLKLITGVLQPNGGEVEIFGKITALLELGAGFNPEFTGRENIRFYANVLGISESQLDSSLGSIIDFAELGSYIDQPVKTYSSGMRARLGFSVAIYVEPDILILDEVLSVGDALFQRKCFAKMESFFNAGKTIIYVSHNANTVRKLCNRAILLHDSRILIDGHPAEVTKYYEKMLFANEENQKDVLAEITEAAKRSDSEGPSFEVSSAPDARVVDVKDDDDSKNERLTSYHLPDFEVETLRYENFPVHIHDCRFETADGERVNVLVKGEEYFFKYKVIFEEEHENVSFNMMIKTLDGVKVFGISPIKERKFLTKVAAGQSLEVVWSISNLLVAENYLTNAGVMSVVEGRLTFLARLVDASIFKVVGGRSSVSGYIDLLSSDAKISYLE